MRTRTMRNAMVALISVAVLAVGANAMAGKGMRDGEEGRGNGSYGQHHRRGDCPYGQGFANLTTEQRDQMDTERQAFFDATRKERQDLHARRLALQAEIAKSDPDMEKASAIQKEVSALQADMDQKRLEHIMTMRKINPDAGLRCYVGSKGRFGERWGPGGCRK